MGGLLLTILNQFYGKKSRYSNPRGVQKLHR